MDVLRQIVKIRRVDRLRNVKIKEELKLEEVLVKMHRC